MDKWICPEYRLPDPQTPVILRVQYDTGRQDILTAQYIPPRTVLSEDFLDPDYSDDFGDYDEKRDCYWTPSGWYEWGITPDRIYWYIDQSVAHVVAWRPLETELLPGGGDYTAERDLAKAEARVRRQADVDKLARDGHSVLIYHYGGKYFASLLTYSPHMHGDTVWEALSKAVAMLTPGK